MQNMSSSSFSLSDMRQADTETLKILALINMFLLLMPCAFCGCYMVIFKQGFNRKAE